MEDNIWIEEKIDKVINQVSDDIVYDDLEPLRKLIKNCTRENLEEYLSA